MLAPIEAEPAHVALDGVDIFLLFLGRIGVVEAQMTAAAELLGDAEVETDRLGVADMQIAVRLGREAGDDRLVPAGREIGANDVADEVLPGFPCRFSNRHGVTASHCREPVPARPDWTNYLAGSTPPPNRNPLCFLSVLAVLDERGGAGMAHAAGQGLNR